ncbi:uncharacterized protein RAG0_14505 [Rhynchosporium agropyri]|uniref:Uncharacterized protein n=1 Tax=Rhynchosporium agropyri TaxID=914238 RepID=A0A1E1LHB5_9HELO|nr:uncharacterized protein RAG0_14505 [Rhynchosporium agropyri]
MEKLCREPMLEETPISELSILSANQPTCSVPRYDSEPDEIIDRLSSSNRLFRTYEEYNMLAVLYEFEEERTPLILWNWFIEWLVGCKVLRRCQFMDGYQISGLLSNFLCILQVSLLFESSRMIRVNFQYHNIVYLPAAAAAALPLLDLLLEV